MVLIEDLSRPYLDLNIETFSAPSSVRNQFWFSLQSWSKIQPHYVKNHRFLLYNEYHLSVTPLKGCKQDNFLNPSCPQILVFPIRVHFFSWDFTLVNYSFLLKLHKQIQWWRYILAFTLGWLWDQKITYCALSFWKYNRFVGCWHKNITKVYFYRKAWLNKTKTICSKTAQKIDPILLCNFVLSYDFF